MKPLVYIILFLTLASCSTEKITFSPVSGTLDPLTEALPLNRSLTGESDLIFYSSELTNQVSNFPRFKNSAVNDEVRNLKIYIKEYVYALQDYNLVAKNKALEKVERSYKNIQKLRKYLNQDEDNVINRYLVRIKSNITKIEAINNKPNSVSIKQ